MSWSFRGDNVFTDLDGFPSNVPNASGMPDVQDGYGLMISELLGNDSPHCSTVPADLNSLHNMGLPNAEVTYLNTGLSSSIFFIKLKSSTVDDYEYVYNQTSNYLS